MASLGGGRILKAREGAFFKSEQEGDLHMYLKKRVAEGKIVLTDNELKALQPGPRVITTKGKDGRPSTGSEDVYEVGMEILQQMSRYETLDSKSKAALRRRVKAQMPEARAEDIQRIATNMAMYGAAGAIYGASHATRIPLGRRSLQRLSSESGGSLAQQPRQLSPEATEAMRRQFMAGLRALTYGSLIGIAGVAAAVTIAAYAYEIGDAQSLRTNIKASFAPLAARLSIATQSLKENLTVSETTSNASENSIKDSDFVRRLKKRFDNFKI